MSKTLRVLSLSVLAVSINAAAGLSAGTVSADRYKALANLPMHGGYPTEAAQQALQDELFFQRASMVYQWALPIVNMHAMKVGHAKMMGGETAYNKIAIYEDRLKPNTVITTPNSDVIYALAWLDMKATGPLIMESPAGVQTLVDDMYHHPLRGPFDKDQPGGQFLGDIGNAGPDKGKGGKFLFLPPGHDRAAYALLEKEYYIYESDTSEVFLFQRSFFGDMNNLDPAVSRVKETKIYPLDPLKIIKPMEFFEVSDVDANAIWDNDYSFFEMLDDAVQNMETATFDQYMNGVMNSIGIKKGVKFNPSERQKELLDYAAKTAWRMSKEVALNFDQKSQPSVGDTWFWKEAPTWVAHGLTDNGNQYAALSDPYFRNRDTGYVNVDAHLHMWTNHYSISNAMLNAKEGAGAKYSGAYKDENMQPLVGHCNYSVTLPSNVPAGLFWSMTAYDAVTASGVDVKNNEWPSLGDRDKPVVNEDGSITLFFGPDAPEDERFAKSNWLQFENDTWFSLIRLYGPTKGIFDGTWVPGEFKKLSCND